MKLHLSKVKLKDIDAKKTPYSYSDNRYDREALLDSIKQMGILNPPVLSKVEGLILKKKNKTFQIITGSRRIKAANKLELDSIPAYITEKITSEEAFKLSILENQSTRDLNLLEKATIIKALKRAKIPDKKIVEVFLPMLGLSPSSKLRDQLLALTLLPKQLASFVTDKNLPLRRFAHLKDVPKPTLKLFSDLVQKLTPGASAFEEITKGLIGVAKIQNKKVEQAAKSLNISSMLKNDSTPKEKRLEKLREAVRQARFPILSKINRELEQEVKKLDLPSFVNIDWDKTLERKQIGIRLSAKEKDELKRGLRELSDDRLKKTLEKFLEKL